MSCFEEFAEALEQNNVAVDKLIWLTAARAATEVRDLVPDEFLDLLECLEDQEFENVFGVEPRDSVVEDDAVALLFDLNLGGFLARALTPIFQDFELDDDGGLASATSGYGHYIIYAYADTVEELVGKLIAGAEWRLERDMQAARKAQLVEIQEVVSHE